MTQIQNIINDELKYKHVKNLSLAIAIESDNAVINAKEKINDIFINKNKILIEFAKEIKILEENIIKANIISKISLPLLNLTQSIGINIAEGSLPPPPSDSSSIHLSS